ncbi:MAG: hypothetical protein Rubg2KO_03240 [Rubricoccaceae bacterium]
MPVAFLLAALALATGPGDTPSLEAGIANQIRVDATLDEPEWAQAEIATDFVQFEPSEGEPSSQRTEVRVLRGTTALYVGAKMYDTDPSAIRTTLSRRDDTGDADHFFVAIDAYNDGQSAYGFGVTAAGVQVDIINSGRNDDESWDAVWTSAARVTAEGWEVEIRIPYSQLRFTGSEAAWGLNFVRQIPRLDEQSFWAPLTSDGAGFPEQLGTLNGVADLEPRRILQAVPYSLARAERFESDVANIGENDFGSELGADLKVGLAPSVILDLTINPDFGQVDADPAELNLSTFETFFSERRPFFLEGTQVFDLGYSRDGGLLYTRRIGGSSPIIGASKLTGRTDGGLAFGALASTTGDDFSPTRFYGAGRLKQVLPRQSYVGAGMTAYQAWGDAGDASTFVGAADWELRVGADEAWQFEGTAGATTQTITDDGVSGSEQGYAIYIGHDKVKGFVTPGFGFRVFSDGFRLNDVGRFRQTDLISVNHGTGIVWNKGQAFGPFRRLQTFAFGSQAWRYTDRINRGGEIRSWMNGTLLGFQDVQLRLGYEDFWGYDVRETRGLDPIYNNANFSINLGYETDSRRQIRAGVDFGLDRQIDGGMEYGTELELDWTVNDRLALSIEGEFGSGVNERSWVTNEGFIRTGDGLFIGSEANAPADLVAEDLVRVPISTEATDALFSDLSLYDDAGYYRPIFAQRNTRSAGITTRANVLFSSTLSLQLYGQLFSARGQFHDYQLLASRDELRPFDDYPRRRDFAFSTFNVNSVLRWEYRPGSSLYVVWTQARNSDAFLDFVQTGSGSFDSPYETSTTEQFQDTFGTFPNNVFLVKLSYLLM